VIAKLPDGLLNANQALISVTAQRSGQSSNQVSVSLSP